MDKLFDCGAYPLLATKFFVFAPDSDDKSEDENPGGMKDMFRFVKEEDQH